MIRDYQKRAVDFMINNNSSFIIAGLGTGKTFTTLTYIDKLYQSKKTKGILVLAPLRVAKYVWPSEIKKWFPGLSFAVLHGKRKDYEFHQNKHIFIMNYEGLEWLHGMIKKTRQMPFDVLVCDESSALKSPKLTKRTRILRTFLPHLKRRVLLTGTPAPNSLLDLFGQMYILDSGQRLGKSVTRFKAEHFYPVDYNRFFWKLLPGHDKTINEKIQDVVFRVTTDEAVKLPDISFQDIDLKLTGDSRKVYRDMEKQLFAEIDGEEVTALSAAAKAIKCLQICSGLVYNEDRKVIRVHHDKIKAVKALVKDLKDENILLFFQFKHEKKDLLEAFPGIRFIGGSSDGDTIESWNRGEIKILAAHPLSAAHGLNLQFGGRTIIWYTLTYSNEQYMQAIGRIYRSGQKENVTVYRFITEKTVEVAIANLLEGREKGQNAFISAIKQYRGVE